MKITIEHYDRKISAELPEGTNITKVRDTIKGLLVAIGFSQEIVEQDTAEEVSGYTINQPQK